MQSQHHEYMNIALDQSIHAYNQCKVPVGAIVVLRGHVVSMAHNALDMTCIESHAEMIAIKSAFNILGRHLLSLSVLYTTLEPCPMCLGFINHARIKRVYYGATSRRKHYKTSMLQICKHTSSTLLCQFFKSKRHFKKL